MHVQQARFLLSLLLSSIQQRTHSWRPNGWLQHTLTQVAIRNRLLSCSSLGKLGNGPQWERLLSDSRELPEFAVNHRVGEEAAYPFFNVSPETDTHALSLSVYMLPLPAD